MYADDKRPFSLRTLNTGLSSSVNTRGAELNPFGRHILIEVVPPHKPEKFLVLYSN